MFILNEHDSHKMSSYLFGLLLNGQGANEGGNFFGRLPLGQLAQTFLSCPDRSVNDLQEKLTRPRVEDENGAVDSEI